MWELKRFDRPTFWVRVVPLLLGHIFVASMLMHGVNGLGAVDMVITVFYARVLAGRFRDIGWPAWIAVTFVIASALVPVFAAGLAIASNAPPATFAAWVNGIAAVTGLLHLVVIVLAGTVPGFAQDDPPPAATLATDRTLPPLAVAAPGAAPSPSPVSDVAEAPSSDFANFSTRDALVVGGGALAIVVILVAAMNGALTPRSQLVQSPQQALAPLTRMPSPVSSGAAQQAQTTFQQQMQVESNGLTKATNDYLRQLSPYTRR